MPHERGHDPIFSDSCRVTLDRTRALTISLPIDTPDNGQDGSPYKIPKRLFPAEDPETPNSEKKKCLKIHWTELTSKEVTSQRPHHNNRTHLSSCEQLHRGQARVILTDVLQTDEGRTYLRENGRGVQAKSQSRLWKGSPESRRKFTDPTQCNVSPNCDGRINLLSQFELSLNDKNESYPDHSSSEESESSSLPRFSSLRPATAGLMKDVNTVPLISGRSLHDGNSGNEVNPQKRQRERRGSAREEAAVPVDDEDGESEVDEEKLEKTEGGQRGGEMAEEGPGARGSVLRLSAGGAEMEMGLADEKAPSKRSMTYASAPEHAPKRDPDPESTERRSLIRRLSKQTSPTPIVVLSSEEEDEGEKGNCSASIQSPEGASDTPLAGLTPLPPAAEKRNVMETHISELHTKLHSLAYSPYVGSTVIELPFSTLYMGGVRALSNGSMKISDDKVHIPLKDSAGASVTVSMATVHVCRYSVWEGSVIRDTGLVQKDECPPPSVLLLWVSESQARRLLNDLSIIQPGTHPAEGSVCVALCVCETLQGVQGALLASIMDIVGLKYGRAALLTPLTHPDSLQVLGAGRDTHLLQLLRPAPGPAAPAHALPSTDTRSPAAAKDSELEQGPAYTLRHSRTGGCYSVSMVTKPGPEWTPYRHRGPVRRLIQFPPPPSKGGLTVTTEDLECLDSGEFLNDVIIDFYLKYLLLKKAPQASMERSHVFSSFFYKQLTRRDNANEDSTSTPALRRRHQRVRTWTRHVDIFDKDFLFVPVNQEAHWYLVVICYPGLEEPQCVPWGCPESGQAAGVEDSGQSPAQAEAPEASTPQANPDKSADEGSSKPCLPPGPPDCTEKTCKRQTVCKRPCILIMDSLKMSVHERIFKLLREYLQVEWEVKRDGQREFNAEQVIGSHCKVPRQNNSSDCGLYLLQYAESFLQDPVVHFDLPLQLDRWFPRQQVHRKREEIRDLVLHLYRYQQGTLGNEGQEDSTDTEHVVF